MQIVVDQLLTNYQLAGKGKLVLWLHGWGDSSKSSMAVQAKLAQHYQVLALDLPGFGGTQAPAEVWGLDDYASFVAAALSKLKLQPNIIIGHSNGGAIAIRGLANGSLSAQKLVLIASAGVRDQHTGRNRLLKVAAKTAKIATKPLPKSVQAKLRSKAYQAIGSELLLAEHLEETFKRVVGDDVQADAQNVTIPALLIYGDRDTATPLRYGQLLAAALPHATLKPVGGAGHFVYLDQPATTVQLVEEFIR